MGFNVTGDAYDRFMGRYSRLLAPQFADFAGVRAGQRVLDVGSGPGALTTVLVERLGADSVTAVDPSPPFVAALGERLPGVRAAEAPAEHLPFGDGEFDMAIAQLVVHFMQDPVAGLREMARVTKPGGVVAACVWDHAGERTPLAVFWRAARELDPKARDESDLAGAHEGHLGELMREAGLTGIEETLLEVPFGSESFDDWWEPFTLGVGPAGEYVARLEPVALAMLRDRARELLPRRAASVRVDRAGSGNAPELIRGQPRPRGAGHTAMHTTRSRLAAALVAAAALTVPVAAANADSPPPIVPVKAIHAKYILPTRDSPFYDSIKDAAIAAGYDVVENDGHTPAS